MRKYYIMLTLLKALLKQPYHAEITKDMLFSMYTIEQLKIGGGKSSCLIIAENNADVKNAEQEFDLQNRIPETDEIITADSEQLRKRVFILDDFGNGIVLYSRTPTGNEKRTE